MRVPMPVHDAGEKPMSSSARVLVAVQLFTLQPLSSSFRVRVCQCTLRAGASAALRACLRANCGPCLRSCAGAALRVCLRAPCGPCMKGLRQHVPPAARMKVGERKTCPPLLLPPPSSSSGRVGWQNEMESPWCCWCRPCLVRSSWCGCSAAAGAAAARNCGLPVASGPRPPAWPAARRMPARGRSSPCIFIECSVVSKASLFRLRKEQMTDSPKQTK